MTRRSASVQRARRQKPAHLSGFILTWDVDSADGSPNVTVPGPETKDHVVVSVPGGFGNPSSDADPDSEADAGHVTVWSGPALTTGG